MSKAFMSVTIDTECDKSLDWSNSNPLTFHSVTHGIPNILQPLFDDLSIKPTYFLSPEVIENPSCVQTLLSIKDHCELGTHLHADYIDPERSFSDFAGKETHAFQTDFSPEIEFLKLKNLTDSFQNAFNYSPKVFRSGRYAANKHTIKSLSELGYKVDSSFTPHLKWSSPLGNIIDHQDSPEQPYFCNHENIYKESDSSLLEIPVTIVDSRKFIFFKKHLWLRPKFSSIYEVKKIFNYVKSQYSENDVIVFNMMFHSQEVIPNASPYTRTAAEVESYMLFLKKVFEMAVRENIQFLTLEEIYDIFNQNKFIK
tara:strand:+ start:801 stop:1736 length:936 start_codon:yes stop_codon:yes gene_type:complete